MKYQTCTVCRGKGKNYNFVLCMSCNHHDYERGKIIGRVCNKCSPEIVEGLHYEQVHKPVDLV